MSDERCPICGGELKFIEDVPFEAWSSGGRIVGPVASAIYDCPKDGRLRIATNGQWAHVAPPKEKS